MRVFATLLLISIGALAHGATPLPSESIYQLPLELRTQDDVKHGLDLYRGDATLISMFYGNCTNVCPLILHTVQEIESQLPTAQRNRLRVLLVSIDAEHDTPASLRELASMHDLDLSRWSVAWTNKDNVRQLAAVLGIQYRKLPDGTFNHSSVITLLDREGRIITNTSLIGRIDTGFVQKLKRTVNGG